MADENTVSRTFDHILISGMGVGPVLNIGKHKFQLKPKVPVTAIVKLISNENNVQGMEDYLIDLIVDEKGKKAFEALLPDISGDGLGELIEWVTEVTANVPLEDSTD